MPDTINTMNEKTVSLPLIVQMLGMKYIFRSEMSMLFSHDPIEVFSTGHERQWHHFGRERCVDARLLSLFFDASRAHQIALKLIINTISEIYDTEIRQFVCVCAAMALALIHCGYNVKPDADILKMRRRMESKECVDVLTAALWRAEAERVEKEQSVLIGNDFPFFLNGVFNGCARCDMINVRTLCAKIRSH